MLESDTRRSFELSSPLVVGDRQLYVISEKLLIRTWMRKNPIFGLLISPIYVVVLEFDKYYAFSVSDGRGADIEDLLQTNPSIKEKLFST